MSFDETEGLRVPAPGIGKNALFCAGMIVNFCESVLAQEGKAHHVQTALQAWEQAKAFILT